MFDSAIVPGRAQVSVIALLMLVLALSPPKAASHCNGVGASSIGNFDPAPSLHPGTGPNAAAEFVWHFTVERLCTAGFVRLEHVSGSSGVRGLFGNFAYALLSPESSAKPQAAGGSLFGTFHAPVDAAPWRVTPFDTS